MQEFSDDRSLIPLRGYTPFQRDLLRAFAARYIWWQTPEESLDFPERILAQVMTLGTYEDLGQLVRGFSPDDLRSVIYHAEPGWFNGRAWAFWHVRLGLVAFGTNPPPLPIRRFA